MSSQRFLWKRMVSHPQFELLGTWKSAVLFALPDTVFIDPNLKNTARSGLQNYLVKLVGEAGQQLLRHPHCAQLPLTLGAVMDSHFGGSIRHRRPRIWQS